MNKRKLEETVLRTKAIMERTQATCLLAVQKYLTNSLKSEISRTADNKLYEKMVESITDKVGEAIKTILFSIWSVETSFYFVPGYNRHSKLGTTRMDIYPEIIKSIDFIECSERKLIESIKKSSVTYCYGYDGKKRFHATPLSIYMSLFYEKRIEGTQLFGFTKWFELNEIDSILVNKETEAKGDPTIAIHVSKVKRQISGSTASGIVTLDVSSAKTPEDLLSAWSNGLINKFFAVKKTKLYPFPPVKDDQEGFLSISELIKLKHKKKITSRERELLKRIESMQTIFARLCYSIFYDARTGYDDTNLLEGAKVFLNKGKKTLEMLGLGNPDWYRNKTFDHYYCIPLGKSLHLGDIREEPYEIGAFLGTINLYTDQIIPRVLLPLFKTWFNSIYNQIRIAESVIWGKIVGKERAKIIIADYGLRRDAHEIWRVIDKIDCKSPEVVDAIRAYLSTIFATRSTRLPSKHYRSFLQSSCTLHDLVDSCIRNTVFPIFKNVLSDVGTEVIIKKYAQMDIDDFSSFAKIDCALKDYLIVTERSLTTADESELTAVRAKQLIAYKILVCGLINMYLHISDDTSQTDPTVVEIEKLSKDEEKIPLYAVVLRNSGDPPGDNQEENKRINTHVTLNTYAVYGGHKDRIEERDWYLRYDKEQRRWITRLPMPKEIFKKVF